MTIRQGDIFAGNRGAMKLAVICRAKMPTVPSVHTPTIVVLGAETDANCQCGKLNGSNVSRDSRRGYHRVTKIQFPRKLPLRPEDSRRGTLIHPAGEQRVAPTAHAAPKSRRK